MTTLVQAFARARSEDRAALIGYLPAGFPTLEGSVRLIRAMVEGGVDIVEVGLPYSDPLMDGPVIQAAAEQALLSGITPAGVIEVAGEADVTITRRWTENGPVLPGQHFDLATITPPGHVMSMAWTALSDRNTSIQTGMRLMRAQTIEDGIAAGEDFVAPAQNLMLAAADGRIAMQVIGRMPWRMNDHETQARMPAPGWVAANRWQGMTLYFANPRFIDPESGMLGNTNNRTVDRAFPLHVTHDWGDTQRITRLSRLMEARDVHTRDSFIEAQLDTVSAAARNILHLVARDLWFTGEAAPAGTPERRRQPPELR